MTSQTALLTAITNVLPRIGEGHLDPRHVLSYILVDRDIRTLQGSQLAEEIIISCACCNNVTLAEAETLAVSYAL